MPTKLRGSAGSLEEAMDTLEHVSYDVADTAAEVHRLFQDLSDRDDIQFKPLGDDYKARETRSMTPSAPSETSWIS